MQDAARKEFLKSLSPWWDIRRPKKRNWHVDLRHNKLRGFLWLDSAHKPAWVEVQLGLWGSGIRKSCSASTCRKESFGSLAARETVLDARTCRQLCEYGPLTEAVDALSLLVHRGYNLSNNLFYLVLKRCIARKDLVSGKRIHALSVKGGYGGNAFLATHLISLYGSQGKLEEAMKVFSEVPTPDAYNWSAIIFAYAGHGEPTQAIEIYKQMRESGFQPDNRIFLAVLKACATAGDLDAGKDVHNQILASAEHPDIFVENALVHMYARCGRLEDARTVFDSLTQKNVVTWTAMIAGYAQQGMGGHALEIYSSMQEEGITPPDSVTFVCLLQACASLGEGALHQVKLLHAQIKERGLQDDVVVGATLVNMYAKSGSVKSAHRVFDQLSRKDVVTWTAMIAGYAQLGMGDKALSLYDSMQQDGIIPPNAVTFVCLLQACANVGVAALKYGKQLHAQIVERELQDDEAVSVSVVNMYAKCGRIDDAQRIFDKIPRKNVVAWTAMIAGYAQHGLAQEALGLYKSMQREGITPANSVTFVCLLQACATVAALPLGKDLHAQIKERGLQADVVVGPALVNMYAKCGSLEDAHQMFDSLVSRDIVAWSALMAGYSRHGDSEAVFHLFDRMRREGIQPDGVTMLSLLTVCSHVGLVDKGQNYFEAMTADYRLSPTIEHYTCMMDLLGRAGYLREALLMAKAMPSQPNAAVWLTLLGACRKWNNVEVGRQAFESAVSLDEKDASSYVLMSNIYAGMRMWDEAKEMQARRLRIGAWKPPGQSWWTDMDGVVHTFVVEDKTHPESEGIYARLQQLFVKIKKMGYVPHLDSSLRDLSNGEKEAELCGHSEKLAIAFALNKTSPGTVIRIAKNLRVCVDCHNATAFISLVEKRTIICRDANRFHVFNDGKCSCRDYW